ncbi:putative long-chain fatty acid CoA ligase [Cryptosporidium serpentis]
MEKQIFSLLLVNSKGAKNASPIYRNPKYADKNLLDLTGNEPSNLWELFLSGVNKGENNPCIGTRQCDLNGNYSEYKFKTYGEVRDLALNVGRNILKRNLAPSLKFSDYVYQEEAKMIGILSRNREEWYIIEQACNAFDICIVPLYDSLGEDALNYALNITQIKTLCISGEEAPKILKFIEKFQKESSKSKEVSKGMCYLKNLVYFDDLPTDVIEIAKKLDILLIKFDNLTEECSKEDKKIYKLENILPDKVCSIHFTSGTTGHPKGAILTHRCFLACIYGVYEMLFKNEMKVTNDDVHLSYLPMAHIFERLIISIAYSCNIRIGIYSGHVKRLVSDAQILRPTILICVPQVLTRIVQAVSDHIEQSNPIVKRIFIKVLNQKEQNIKTNGNPYHWFWDKILFRNTKQILGGRLRGIVSGAAPLSIDINYRIQALFCCRIVEGYGMSECIAALISNFEHCNIGHVGGPVGDIELKLVSEPEMGYDATKEPRRGSLRIRGNSICRGYFRDRNSTNESIDNEGWLDTGDIAERLPNGAFRIIDRKKALFKLAQGEYISPEKIEAIYTTASPIIQQVYVYGLSTDRFIVALVFPNQAVIHRWAENHSKIDDTLETLCEDNELVTEVEKAFKLVEKKSNLLGYEKIRNFKIVPTIMTTKNGLMTPTMKVMRHKVNEKFKDLLNTLRLNTSK